MLSLKSIIREFPKNRSFNMTISNRERTTSHVVASDDVVSVVLSHDDSDVIHVYDGMTLIWSSASGVDIVDWEADPEIVLDDVSVFSELIKICDSLSWFSADASI